MSLGWHDGAVERIAVIGTSGSGKTTLARRLAAKLDLPHLELDAIYHQPNWEPLPDDEFQRQVAEFCAQDRWVTCGKYRQVREILFEKADTIVCLDHNRVRQTARVVKRTAVRASRHEELWNGNLETWRGLWPDDGEKSIVRWTWDNVPRARMLFAELEARHWDSTQVVRLRGWPAVGRFIETAAR